MRDRGHDVEVVAAHPHYPVPVWGQRLLPYREVDDGILVTRLPLWNGHRTTRQRLRKELTYALSATGAAAALRPPDAAVVVSPAFTALAPMIVNARVRRVPWILWLQDILPDAAATTGLLESSTALRLARKLESAAYGSADRIVAISYAFRENLLAKGVPAEKIEVIRNPATRDLGLTGSTASQDGTRILCMGNIGYSQGVVEVVRAFERSPDVPPRVRLVITGHGEFADAVRAAAVSDRVEMRGLVSSRELDHELERASLGLISQRAGIVEFNLPSKLMNLMARGIPVLACVPSSSEVARIVREARAGWIVDSGDLDALGPSVRDILGDRDELERRGSAGREYAKARFSPDSVAERFERVLATVVRDHATVHGARRSRLASPRVHPRVENFGPRSHHLAHGEDDVVSRCRRFGA